ncbi:hypothetical protein WJX72_008412 [[Myrmecia] bisecta]|uniref:Uncharacterized protein n=1 Tax=[Myrmecia] bisecta TaxID=41462 RepID=A0AAW1Q9G1_9CHLO
MYLEILCSGDDTTITSRYTVTTLNLSFNQLRADCLAPLSLLPRLRQLDISAYKDYWEEVDDPTVQLSLALGMNPAKLAIYNGHLGTDSTKAVNALRFALTHPLAHIEAGLHEGPGHLATTQSTKAKQRQRFLKPLPERGPTPPDYKTQKIQKIEVILRTMKDRLHVIEDSLVHHEAATIPEDAQPEAAG